MSVPGRRLVGGNVASVAILSAAILGHEVSLLRILLVLSWHHFAFLVLSIALVGFGASGTFLYVARPWAVRHGRVVVWWLALATACSMPLSVACAQAVPTTAYFVPVLIAEEAANWVLFWGVLAIPFFFGASAIGLSLIVAGERVGRTYASNLAGSGLGALLAPAVMPVVPPGWLPLVWGALAVVAAVMASPRSRGLACAGTTLSVLALTLFAACDDPELRVDPHKYLAYVRRLMDQGAASLVAEAHGPRGAVQIFRGDAFHEVPFLSVDAEPVGVDALVVDGHWAASIPRVGTAEEAAMADSTLMAFPYALAAQRPDVLLLGERGGLNAWLAVRQGARRIVLVEPDSNLFDLYREHLPETAGRMLQLQNVTAVCSDPRHFVATSEDRFDVVQIVTLESSAAGSGGMGGLGQDHLVTVEGLTASLHRLTDGGVLFACRGIQTPPRDNLKLLRTVTRALERLGKKSPEDHVVVVRDYLAVCTIVRSTPWTTADVEKIRREVARRQLTPVWFVGIREDELNRPDALPGPPGTRADWYTHGARQLFGPEAEEFVSDWLFDIRAPTDDRPFFLDFSRLRAIQPLRRAFGDLWLTRTEIAFVFVLAALAVTAGIGAVLSVVPLVGLAWRGRGRVRFRGVGSAGVYFASIGTAYLLFEITVLSHSTLLIGDPVRAASCTLALFLLASGAGSLLASVRPRGFGTDPRRAMALLVGLMVAEVLLFGWLEWGSDASALLERRALAALLVVPAAVLMGLPMPAALARLSVSAPRLMPWAWGVNGFASVFAAPLATAMAMSWGFQSAGLLAALLYLAAMWAFARLPAGVGAGESQ